MQKRSCHTGNAVNVAEVGADPTPISRPAALAALGEVVYAVRLDDGVIKIGSTTNLAQRLRSLKAYNGSETGVVVAFTPGDRDDERAIHEALVDHRVYGREYYHPVPEVLAVVNDMRDRVGLPHIAA